MNLQLIQKCWLIDLQVMQKGSSIVTGNSEVWVDRFTDNFKLKFDNITGYSYVKAWKLML